MKTKKQGTQNNQGNLFALGSLYVTPGVQDLLTRSEVFSLLARHSQGDWGICDEEDSAANEDALLSGARIFSAYISQSNEKVWVITEADRSATTVLLPAEY